MGLGAVSTGQVPRGHWDPRSPRGGQVSQEHHVYGRARQHLARPCLPVSLTPCPCEQPGQTPVCPRRAMRGVFQAPVFGVRGVLDKRVSKQMRGGSRIWDFP